MSVARNVYTVAKVWQTQKDCYIVCSSTQRGETIMEEQLPKKQTRDAMRRIIEMTAMVAPDGTTWGMDAE